MKNDSTKSGGIGFIGALQLVFIVLKLIKVISWSWWVVLLPIEISIALVILAIMFIIWENK